jgi:TonB family protein
MQPRPFQIAPLVVRIFLLISICIALAYGHGFRTRAQERDSGRTQGDTKSQAQRPPADVQELANPLASNISRSHRGKVLVLDFKGPDKLWLPFSAWLADQFCAALESSGERLEVVPRSKLTAAIADRRLEPRDTFDEKTAEALADSLEAQVIVSGSFAAIRDMLGISMAVRTNHGDSWTAQPMRDRVRGKISLPSQVSARFAVPLDSLRPRDGVFQDGEGGVGIPSCIRCTLPKYSYRERHSGVEGVIWLEAILTMDGRVTQVKVTSSVDSALDHKAVSTVQSWKLKPATDPDGNAVPTRQTIKMNIHFD